MRNKINEELLKMVTGGVLAVPSLRDEPKTKKGEETCTVDFDSDSTNRGGATGGW